MANCELTQGAAGHPDAQRLIPRRIDVYRTIELWSGDSGGGRGAGDGEMRGLMTIKRAQQRGVEKKKM